MLEILTSSDPSWKNASRQRRVWIVNHSVVVLFIYSQAPRASLLSQSFIETVHSLSLVFFASSELTCFYARYEDERSNRSGHLGLAKGR